MAKRAAADVRGLPTVKELYRALARRTPANADAVDAGLETRCVRDLTVLVCDTSGFTRRTHDYGILNFLAVMNRVYGRLRPHVKAGGGVIIDAAADDMLALFDDPPSAARAARAMQREVAAYNRGKTDREQLQICIGLHCGRVLRLKDGVYGDKVNVAAKIGEDLADAGQIVATGEIVARLPATMKRAYLRSITLGGKSFELHRVEY